MCLSVYVRKSILWKPRTEERPEQTHINRNNVYIVHGYAVPSCKVVCCCFCCFVVAKIFKLKSPEEIYSLLCCVVCMFQGYVYMYLASTLHYYYAL